MNWRLGWVTGRRRGDRMLQILAVIFLAVLLAPTVYLYVQNRSLPELNSKVIPVVMLGVVGLLFTIWYSLKSEQTDLHLASTVYFHRSDLLPLDEHAPRRHLYGGDQFNIGLAQLIRDRIAQDTTLSAGDLEKRRENAEDLYFDIVLLKLIDRFFFVYADSWDVRIRSTRYGNNVESIVSSNTSNQDSVSLTWDDFSMVLDGNDPLHTLFSSLPKGHWPMKMTVPPKTKVRLTTTSRIQHSLALSNPFARISITLVRRGGGIGLGDYAWFLEYDRKQSEEFWSEYIDVNCQAEFERTRSGHPLMPAYRRWVEAMFSELRYQLSDEERMQRAREYRDLTSRPQSSGVRH